MRLLSPEVEVYFGRDALARPRKAKLPVDLTMTDAPRLGDPFDVQELIRRRNRTAITPQRAARLIEARLPNVGDKITTAEFHLSSEDDDFLDLLAVLSFHRANGKKLFLRWRIHSSRNLLSIGRQVPLGEVNDASETDLEWIGNLAPDVRDVLNRGLRIAQESLNWDWLRLQKRYSA